MHDYPTLDAIAMARLVRRRELSPLELVEAAIARLKSRDQRRGPQAVRAGAPGGAGGGPCRTAC